MSWLDAYALHIFLPDTQFNNWSWVEQILGAVILPVVTKYNEKIEWIWLTRYRGSYDQDNPPVGYTLTEEYRGFGAYSFVVFRCSVDKTIQSELHKITQDLAKQNGYFVPEWVRYDAISDLGSDRFAPSNSSDPFREERAHLVLKLIDSTIRLMLHSLTRDDKGLWHLEKNDSSQNPKGSIFESLHHLFCNASGVPIDVLVSKRNNEIGFQTYWMGSPYIIELTDQDFDTSAQLQY